jgi:hypothetical protein
VQNWCGCEPNCLFRTLLNLCEQCGCVFCHWKQASRISPNWLTPNVERRDLWILKLEIISHLLLKTAPVSMRNQQSYCHLKFNPVSIHTGENSQWPSGLISGPWPRRTLRFEAKNPAMYHELNGEDLISFYAKANKLRPRMSPHFTGAPVHCAEPGGGRSAESNLIQKFKNLCKRQVSE